MQYGFRALDPRPGRGRTLRLTGATLVMVLAGTMLVVLSAVAFGTMSHAAAPARSHRGYLRLVAHTRSPASATSVLTGGPDVIAAEVARGMFASAPVVVVADASRPADQATAAALAEQAHAPLLLTSGTGSAGTGSARTGGARTSGARTGTADQANSGTSSGATRGTAGPVSAALRTEISALGARTVLAVGATGKVLSAQLPGIDVVTNPAMLPATKAPTPLGRVVLLVHQGDSGAATMAAATTARVAGARVIAVDGYDPRADPAAIAALSAAKPQRVLAIGASFGSASQLASRVAVAVTGVQLPGGGQVLFPMRRLVALYGHPGDPALGALGQQGLRASIARVRKAAAAYRALSSVPVVPAFEIIATVAQASPGRDGSYSYESTVASLRPWVSRATADGLYVILDLQPGRASLLAQARKYQPLLELPNVGLALDPEWKLQPGQLPLQQIGSVGIAEVNSVISWLAGLTARYHLPQKLLVLHQFRLSMIADERRLDTHRDDLAILIHMDGQGSPADKQQTWNAVIKAAPAGVYFGWKNFYAKDHPMLGPRQTMARNPEPVMISYQ
ncbi:MAG: hypothetical protein ABSB01_16025 [Streptosporangiaceae bacterium]|jgi:hypothetical protein